MDSLADITQKHMLTVKEMGILEDEINITKSELKDISVSLGMTEAGWNHVMNLAEEKQRLAKSHLSRKSYRKSIEEADESLLCNPYLHGSRGIKAHAYWMLYKVEDIPEYREQAIKQAELTLDKEPRDLNALKVTQAISSDDRIRRDPTEKSSKKNVLIIGAILVLAAVGIFYLMLNGNSAAVSEAENVVIDKQKEIESVFDKQEAMIPKVKVYLEDNPADQKLRNSLMKLEKKLDKDLSFKEEFTLQEELTDVLSEVIYKEATENETEVISMLVVQLEGIESRLTTKRKQYNEAVSQLMESSNKNNLKVKYEKI